MPRLALLASSVATISFVRLTPNPLAGLQDGYDRLWPARDDGRVINRESLACPARSRRASSEHAQA
jgi:hypothetical protein